MAQETSSTTRPSAWDIARKALGSDEEVERFLDTDAVRGDRTRAETLEYFATIWWNDAVREWLKQVNPAGSC